MVARLTQAAALIGTCYISSCYLASCRVSDRMLVLCYVPIWGHTVKDHHNFAYRPDTTPGSVTRSALQSQKVSPAAPGPEGTGKEAISDRVSHHFAEARIGKAAPAASSISRLPATDRMRRGDPRRTAQTNLQPRRAFQYVAV